MARRRARRVSSRLGSPKGNDSSVILINSHILVGLPDRGRKFR